MNRALTLCASRRLSARGLVVIFVQRAALAAHQDVLGVTDGFRQEMAGKEIVLSSTSWTWRGLDP
jgi:hypothetical protein